VPEKLNVENMNKASKILIGTHDFRAFTSAKSKKKSTIRSIESIIINKNNPIISIEYAADGFLYNMVRILTGTLIEIGNGTREINNIYSLLDSKNRAEAGYKAPAHGLFLEKVIY
jgi:tRNA pseudouridine38-40 synthase